MGNIVQKSDLYPAVLNFCTLIDDHLLDYLMSQGHTKQACGCL